MVRVIYEARVFADIVNKERKISLEGGTSYLKRTLLTMVFYVEQVFIQMLGKQCQSLMIRRVRWPLLFVWYKVLVLWARRESWMRHREGKACLRSLSLFMPIYRKWGGTTLFLHCFIFIGGTPINMKK